jgi:hypothetical protein
VNTNQLKHGRTTFFLRDSRFLHAYSDGNGVSEVGPDPSGTGISSARLIVYGLLTLDAWEKQ